MAKHDVNKTLFLKKFSIDYSDFFLLHSGQIDSKGGTESFASISAKFFKLSKKSGKGAEYAPSGVRDNSV